MPARVAIGLYVPNYFDKCSLLNGDNEDQDDEKID